MGTSTAPEVSEMGKKAEKVKDATEKAIFGKSEFERQKMERELNKAREQGKGKK